jgi:hypothetical protein
MSNSWHEKPVLDYASPSRERFRSLDTLLWLMPVWCGLIIATVFWSGRPGDDPLWYVAMALSLAAAVGCAFRRRWILAWYCLFIFAAILAVAVALPSFSHAI